MRVVGEVGEPSGPSEAVGVVTVSKAGATVDMEVADDAEDDNSGSAALIFPPLPRFFSGGMLFPSSTTIRSLRWKRWKVLIFLPSST